MVAGASALSGLIACATERETRPSDPNTVEVLVAASDYSSSAVCGLPGACRSGVALGKDPQLTQSRGRAFFLARDTDRVFELDAASGVPISDWSVHIDDTRLANPHDAAVAPDGSVWLTLFNLSKVVVLRDGKVDGAPIDLSSFDDDGNPEVESVRIVDVGGVPKAFVTLERLEFVPKTAQLLATKPAHLLRIDVATRAVEQTIVLAGKNPFNPMFEHGGGLFMAEPGNFDEAKEPAAGIERFDVATGTSRIVVAEASLEGSVSEVAVTDGCGAAIVAGPEPTVNPTSVLTFDPETGAVGPVALGPTPGYDLQGLAWRGDTLYVGDRRPGADGYVIHVLERDVAAETGVCTLRVTGRTISSVQRPVALRPASSTLARPEAGK